VRSLASRLVLVGIGQLVLLVIAAFAIWFVEVPHDEAKPAERLNPAAIAQLEAIAGQPDALAAALEDLHKDRIEVSIYSAARQLVASNVDPPLWMPPERRHPGGPADGSASLDHPRPTHTMVTAIDLGAAGRGVLVARGVHRTPTILGPLLTFICGLAILIIGALITARWIVRPIEQLSRTARALGAGNLAARSRLSRADEIGELGRRVDEMAERITQLIVSEKELLANVAHELRTPLARIGVALDLASEGDAAAARSSLAEIAVDVAELGGIVDDILIAMRFELDDAGRAGGALPLRREHVAPRAIAEAAAERMRARHAARPLTVQVADALPALDADPRLLRRVVDNLLENAHKYTPDPDRAIDLVVGPGAAGTVCFEVKDRGIGIPADDLPKVFAAFFRGDRSRSRETGGVGLGLTLAKRIVEAHGGTIAVDSETGAGTTVRVVVPPAAPA
jgi:two-component system, OmpR family, sensor kinase